LQRPVATRERQLDWDCGRRSADRRVKRCQRRVRGRTDENMTSWARLVARTRQKAGRLLFGQSWSSGRASQLAAAQRGETGKTKHTLMCPVCAHEGAGTRRRGERRGSGEHGWEGRGVRDEGKVFYGSPLCVNTPTKQRSLTKASKDGGNGGLVDWLLALQPRHPASETTTTAPACQ